MKPEKGYPKIIPHKDLKAFLSILYMQLENYKTTGKTWACSPLQTMRRCYEFIFCSVPCSSSYELHTCVQISLLWKKSVETPTHIPSSPFSNEYGFINMTVLSVILNSFFMPLKASKPKPVYSTEMVLLTSTDVFFIYLEKLTELSKQTEKLFMHYFIRFRTINT